LKQLADLELDEVEQFGIVNRVDLVQRNDQIRDVHLAASSTCSRVCGIGPSTADTTRMAPSICAAPVSCLDVVGVTRAVHVRVVTVRRRVLDVARRDGENLRLVAAPLRLEALATSSYGMNFAQPLSRRPWSTPRSSVVLPWSIVADRADVDVRFGAIRIFSLAMSCAPSLL
jgi:hypothetical protein